MKEYITFTNLDEVAKANGRYLFELYKNGEIMEDRKSRKDSSKTTLLDWGEELKSGEYACIIPAKHELKFKGNKGKKIKLAKDKFKGKVS